MKADASSRKKVAAALSVALVFGVFAVDINSAQARERGGGRGGGGNRGGSGASMNRSANRNVGHGNRNVGNGNRNFNGGGNRVQNLPANGNRGGNRVNHPGNGTIGNNNNWNGGNRNNFNRDVNVDVDRNNYYRGGAYPYYSGAYPYYGYNNYNNLSAYCSELLASYGYLPDGSGCPGQYAY